jgi:hypothetical protein
VSSLPSIGTKGTYFGKLIELLLKQVKVIDASLVLKQG